jgi:hypothetical protein
MKMLHSKKREEIASKKNINNNIPKVKTKFIKKKSIKGSKGVKDSLKQVEDRRYESQCRLKAAWANIIKRYQDIPPEETDVIDLATEKVIVDRGILQKETIRYVGELHASKLTQDDEDDDTVWQPLCENDDTFWQPLCENNDDIEQRVSLGERDNEISDKADIIETSSTQSTESIAQPNQRRLRVYNFNTFDSRHDSDSADTDSEYYDSDSEKILENFQQEIIESTQKETLDCVESINYSQQGTLDCYLVEQIDYFQQKSLEIDYSQETIEITDEQLNSEIDLSQDTIEITDEQLNSEIDLSQDTIEIIDEQLNSEIDLSQGTIEIIDEQFNSGINLSQDIIEITDEQLNSEINLSQDIIEITDEQLNSEIDSSVNTETSSARSTGSIPQPNQRRLRVYSFDTFDSRHDSDTDSEYYDSDDEKMQEN